MNATNTPTSSELSATIEAPKYIARAIPTAVSMSTPGRSPEANLPAVRFASLCDVFLSSNISRLRGCLFRLCTTLTPDIFSLKAAFTIDMRILTAMNDLLAYFCHTNIIATRIGTTTIEISASCTSKISKAIMIPTRLKSSPRLITTRAANS